METQYTFLEWLVAGLVIIFLAISGFRWKFREALGYDDIDSSNVSNSGELLRKFSILKSHGVDCKLVTFTGGPRGLTFGGNNQCSQILRVSKKDIPKAFQIIEEYEAPNK